LLAAWTNNYKFKIHAFPQESVDFLRFER